MYKEYASKQFVEEYLKNNGTYIPITSEVPENADIWIDPVEALKYKDPETGEIKNASPTVQSDWTQNDIAAKDYIKNRTHYQELTYGTIDNVTIPKFTTKNGLYKNNPFATMAIFDSLSIIEANKIDIDFDGITYTCSVINIDNTYYIGNMALCADNEINTGEPFCIIFEDPYKTAIFITDTIVTQIEGELINVNVTEDNISNFFEITNNNYYFNWNGNSFVSNNINIDDSSATTTLTALTDIQFISFDYSVSSESNYDIFKFTVNDKLIKSLSGESSGSWSGELPTNQTIKFQYLKDGSANNGTDCATISNIIITQDTRTSNSHVFKFIGDKIIVHQLDKKFIPDSVYIQPDQNQNNPEAKDYIRNRTHYKVSSNRTPFNSYDITFENYTFNCDEYGYYYLESNNYNNPTFSSQYIYYVILDGLEYKCNPISNKLSTDDFTIYTYSGSMEIYCNHSNMTHTISIYEVKETYYKLDAKYLPSSQILLQPVLNQNDEIDYYTPDKTKDELEQLWNQLMSGTANIIPYVLIKNFDDVSTIAYLTEVNSGDGMYMYFQSPYDGYRTTQVIIDAGYPERCGVSTKNPITDHDENIYAHEDIRAMLKNAIYQGVPNNLPIASNWCDMAAGTNMLIIISTDGEIATYNTKYGGSWQVETDNDLSTYGNWKAVASCNGYGGGDYQVIVGLNASDKIARYYNYGWLQMKTLPHIGNWDHIVYGANKFIVLDSEVSNQGAYSDNGGNTWNEITLPVSAGWGVLTYIDEKFIALANKDSNGNEGSNIGMYSEDGINWTSFTMPESMIWTDIVRYSYDYYAFGYNLTNNTSSTFTIEYYTSNYNNWYKKWSYPEIKTGSIAHNGNIYIRLKNNSLIEYSKYLSQKDWTELTIPEGNWNAVKCCNQTFFLLKNNSNRFAYSKDGLNWIVNDFYLFNSDGEGIIEDLKTLINEDIYNKTETNQLIQTAIGAAMEAIY